MLRSLILRGVIALTLVALTACKQEGGSEAGAGAAPGAINSPTLPDGGSNISAPSPVDSTAPIEAVGAPNGAVRAVNGAVRAVEETEGGGVVLIGDFTAIGEVPAPGIAFLDANGNIDSERQSAVGSGATGTIETVEHLDDGTLLLGGNLSTFNGQPVSNIVALNSNAQMDPVQTTALGSKSTGGISAIAISATGEVALLGGPENTNAVVIADPDESIDSAADSAGDSTDPSILDALNEKKDRSCPTLLAELSALKKQVSNKKSALRAAQSSLKKDNSKKHSTDKTKDSIKQLSKELKDASAARKKQSKIVRAAKCGSN